MLAILNKKISRFLTEGHERSVKTKQNIIVSFIVKGGSIIVGLMLIPMTINYVSPLQYGIWLTISSIVSWMNFFDIGMALGLRNNLTHSLAVGEVKNANKYISTTYAVPNYNWLATLYNFLLFEFLF